MSKLFEFDELAKQLVIVTAERDTLKEQLETSLRSFDSLAKTCSKCCAKQNAMFLSVCKAAQLLKNERDDEAYEVLRSVIEADGGW